MLWYFSDDSKKAHESVVQSGSDDNVETQIDAMAQVIGDIHEAYQRDLLTPEQEQAYLNYLRSMGVIED